MRRYVHDKNALFVDSEGVAINLGDDVVDLDRGFHGRVCSYEAKIGCDDKIRVLVECADGDNTVYITSADRLSHRVEITVDDVLRQYADGVRDIVHSYMRPSDQNRHITELVNRYAGMLRMETYVPVASSEEAR